MIPLLITVSKTVSRQLYDMFKSLWKCTKGAKNLATTRHKDILRVAQDETAMHFYPFQK